MAELAVVLATYNEADNLTPLVVALEDLGEDLALFVPDRHQPASQAGPGRRVAHRPRRCLQ